MFAMILNESDRDQEFLNQVKYMLGDEQTYFSAFSVKGGTKDARLWVEDEKDEAVYGVIALDVESKDEDYIKDVFEDLNGRLKDKGDLIVDGSIENYKNLDKVFQAYQEARDL
jgi:hypothetical protein